MSTKYKSLFLLTRAIHQSESANGWCKPSSILYLAARYKHIFNLYFSNDPFSQQTRQILSFSEVPNFRSVLKIHSRKKPKALWICLKTINLPAFVLSAVREGQDTIEFDKENQNGRDSSSSICSSDIECIYSRFYSAIQSWIDSGCPYGNSYGFYREVGICSNLGDFARRENFSEDQMRFLLADLKSQFISAGLHHAFPFNHYNDYNEEKNKYTNPQRLAWIKSHLPK